MKNHWQHFVHAIKEKNRDYSFLLAMRLFFLLIAIGLIFLDFMFKTAAVNNLQEGQEVNFLPGFIQLQLAFNQGAAFGSGSANPKLVFGLQIVVSSMVLVSFFFVQKKRYFIAVTLIFAGAVGNILDRFANTVEPGKVVDYLSWVLFPPYSIFNFADILIVSGVILTVGSLIINLFTNYKEK